MKNLIRSIIFVGLMVTGSSSWAIPFTTGLTLGGSTDGNICPTGCFGEITLDLPAPLGTIVGPLSVPIIDIDIVIKTTGTPLTFSATSGLATITNGDVSLINLILSTSAGHTLFVAGNDWGLGGPTHVGGGSSVAVPEPAGIAMLGIGLIAFCIVALMRRRKSAEAPPLAASFA